MARPRNGWGYWVAAGWLAVVALAAIAAPILPMPDPALQDIPNRLAGIGAPGHPLGTDGLGRDLLSRLVWGSRLSFVISVSVVFVGFVIGVALGVTVGYLRGRVDSVAMAIMDLILAFPTLIFLLTLVAFLGRSIPTLIGVLAFLAIPGFARVARSVTLSVAAQEHVLASRSMGASHARIIMRNVLPNVLPNMAAIALLVVGIYIVVEGALSFLGLSVQPPDATWGTLIADGIRYLRQSPVVVIVPSMALFLTVLSMNFLGDRLRNRLEIKESDL